MKEHKRYISVVHQIRDMIQLDRLSAGSRIPSERELSERFGVARSSVREALRALELLGLIETRRGEGTFLRDFRDHHLIDLLGMFILQDGRAISDVAEVKSWIEADSIRRLMSLTNKEMLHVYEHISAKYNKSELQTFSHFKKEIVEAGGNQLYVKIWLVLNDFYYADSQDTVALTHEKISDFYHYLQSEDTDSLLNLLNEQA
ncbi:FadR/GntR family transcriptional regulator [Jeotgalibacillus salarius]|uniref:FadR family transcriptional regulator n=1 Tax=Jeotgalibacillus salarius TaxID=546023 RepID=A0A4Y8LE44_9BACL|nr:GntR family transcriptional regulator [Jeotgalibacillus salarius]TFE00935.1 FadR family transcriptional regulator [Jeotgalibacillus salarius]